MELGRKALPDRLRVLLRNRLSLPEYDIYLRKKNNPYVNDTPYMEYPDSPCRLGILEEFYQYHKFYIAACRELNVSYRLIDIARNDWQQCLKGAECNAFLVWPATGVSIWKEMFDERLRIMDTEMGLTLYPSFDEVWIYESKRRVHMWLQAAGIPHPKTWCFYNLREALNFLEEASLPIVFKTNAGATTSGVVILRDRRNARKLVKKAFRKGIAPKRRNPMDRQWGFVLFQEYLPEAKEWRMVRIGDSYFGYRKEKVGDFHSGSHAWSWLDPPRPLLDLLHEVTEKGGFTSMDVDIFETRDGRLLVNELQTVFGASTPADQLRVNGKPGRYRLGRATGKWIFEEGDFSRNACANERIDYLITSILANKTARKPVAV